MELTEKTTLVEWLRFKGFAVYSIPHPSGGWMGHVRNIKYAEDLHWTHPPVKTYEEGIKQAIEYCLEKI